MLRVAFMVFIRTRFFINDDDGTDNDDEGIDDDADNNNADDAVCDCIFFSLFNNFLCSLYIFISCCRVVGNKDRNWGNSAANKTL
jgi:hypothetical protein